MTDKWIDTLHQDLILLTACRYNLDGCIDHSQQLFQEWFDHPLNTTIEINRREIVYSTNMCLRNQISRLQSALTYTSDIRLIRYLLEIHFNRQINIIRQLDIFSGIRSICHNSIAINECWSYDVKQKFDTEQ
ncbi:unnamed protein product [Rotaria sordida]|uniref:Uncharacterized protein n=1 Tax=Rotaria sordida TaxID=392033 RepID=A0A818QKR3_9BILA|nr:unnamed protein product [Rotaria sordida]